MKILIVEDEELAAEKLALMVSSIEKEAQIIGSTGSIKATVDWLQNNETPDLILMDIELSDGQSFEIFNQVDVTSMVVFTTSYDEFALKAFKVNSIDYLLKPVQKEELEAALNKYRQMKKMYAGNGNNEVNMDAIVKELQQKLQPKEFRKRFLVKHGQKL